jgi:hypothetical protein
MPRYQGYGASGSEQRGYGRSRHDDESETYQGRQNWRRDEDEEDRSRYGRQAAASRLRAQPQTARSLRGMSSKS